MTPRIIGGELTATSYADVSAMLTALGSSYEGQVRLVSRSTGLTIGRWAYVGTAITPIGPVRFDRVSASKYALVTSRDSDTQATLTAGHTLPASGTAYVWDTSGAVALHTALAFTVSGNTLTTTDALAAALAAGDQIWVADTELCVGTGCALVPEAGATVRFVANGLSQVDRVVHQWAGVYRAARLRAWLASYTALSATSKRLMVGWTADSTNWSGIGWSRTAAPAIVSSRESGNKTLATAAAAAVGTYPWIGANLFLGPTTATSRWYHSADQIALASAVQFVDISETAYAAAKFYTVADDGAVFSRVEIG